MSPNHATGVLDSSGHPPVEAIADYLEDLLPPAVTEELRSHFADCAECLDTHAALEEIRSLLGRTESPRLPDDIGIRIDAALAAESLLSASASRPAAEPAAELRTAAGGGALRGPVAPTGPSRPPQGPRDDSPSRRGPAGRHPGGGSRRWRRAAAGLAVLAAVGFVGTVLVETGQGSRMAATPASAPKGAAAATNGSALQFTAADLPQQIRELLRGTLAGATRSQPPTAGTANSSPPLHTFSSAGAGAGVEAVPTCVLDAVGRKDTLLAARSGSYQGRSAIAVVYPDTKDPEHLVDVYLVDTSCARGSTGVQPANRKDDVLLTRTLPSQ